MRLATPVDLQAIAYTSRALSQPYIHILKAPMLALDRVVALGGNTRFCRGQLADPYALLHRYDETYFEKCCPGKHKQKWAGETVSCPLSAFGPVSSPAARSR